MRLITSALVVVVMAVAAGCARPDVNPTATRPQNDGANADVQKVLHLRNVFLLSGADPASPAPEQALYAVLINQGGKPARLDRVTVDGGGAVQLAGPIELPPGHPVGTGEKPIGTVTGVRRDTVPMTFTFSGLAPVRLNVPVKSRMGPYAGLTPGPAEAPAPSSTAGAQPTVTPSAHGE
ncbi:hypothetical protein GCM10022419_052480 [Nonomuraea rosea]|uniref:Copper chaperone PCu(A)C n=1 Tax=Nonomuraea rosea TaxID=638574 RepID=A0ABP6XF55_9ACTN